MLITVDQFEYKGINYELEMEYTYEAGDFTNLPFEDVEINQGWLMDSPEEISEEVKNGIEEECYDAMLEACRESYMDACSQEGY